MTPEKAVGTGTRLDKVGPRR